jgi:AraC-like DNA-binding protein
MSDIACSGELSIARVATHLGTSPRTLQRNLSRHGITYRELVDSVRREIALVMLVETNLPVHTIATRLGYRTPSAFSRAFTRWTGQAPCAARRRRNVRGSSL